MRVAVIQQKNQSDLQANLEHSLSLIREAADQGAELVLLQELHRLEILSAAVNVRCPATRGA